MGGRPGPSARSSYSAPGVQSQDGQGQCHPGPQDETDQPALALLHLSLPLLQIGDAAVDLLHDPTHTLKQPLQAREAILDTVQPGLDPIRCKHGALFCHLRAFL